MNYYNPYFSSIPYTSTLFPTKGRLFGRLFSNVNFSTILSGTQKTLNLVNQAIPLIKQAGPVLNNAKTMFKVMNEFKKTDINLDSNNVNNVTTSTNKTESKIIQQTNKPTFLNKKIRGFNLFKKAYFFEHYF